MGLYLGNKIIAGSGRPGKDFSIDGQYDNYDAMIQANPNPEEDLAFQLLDTGDIWQYSTLQAKWINLGPLKGPQGDPGKDGKNGNPGKNGENGKPGKDGDSAYQIAVNLGYVGTEEEWLKTLVGPAGKDGKDGEPGKDGANGQPGQDGKNGEPGQDGKNGDPGFSPIADVSKVGKTTTITITDETGTTTAQVLDGADGKQGEPGNPGQDGQKGDPGKSAYQSAQDGGYIGTEEQFNSSISKIIYSGSTEPSTSLGKDGDIYVKF